MGLKVDPVTLTDCGRALAFLGDDIKDTRRVPHLYADDCVKAMRDSPMAAALADADGASTQAKNVVQNRYYWIAHLLYMTAKNFHDTDAELALYLAGMGDLIKDGK
ncbi:hypothetical protein [Nocardia sp. BMG51109]|uniref:hypothetical protein n=1 Tax=Nocardia sp. BMG51109 TaxID=1056816 RepID=UPI000465FBDD|nr:hypothetical protein [Nocardia sp. BMG51109]